MLQMPQRIISISFPKPNAINHPINSEKDKHPICRFPSMTTEIQKTRLGIGSFAKLCPTWKYQFDIRCQSQNDGHNHQPINKIKINTAVPGIQTSSTHTMPKQRKKCLTQSEKHPGASEKKGRTDQRSVSGNPFPQPKPLSHSGPVLTGIASPVPVSQTRPPGPAVPGRKAIVQRKNLWGATP